MKKPIPADTPVIGKIDPNRIPPVSKWKLRPPPVLSRVVFRTKPTTVTFLQTLTEWSPFFDPEKEELMPTGYAGINFSGEIADSPLYPYPLTDRSVVFKLHYFEEKDNFGDENGILRPSLHFKIGGESFDDYAADGVGPAKSELLNKAPQMILYPELDSVKDPSTGEDIPVMQGVFAGYPNKKAPDLVLRLAFSKLPVVTRYHYLYADDPDGVGLLLESPDLTMHEGRPLIHNLLYKVEYLSGTVTDCVVEFLWTAIPAKEDNFASDYGPGPASNDFSVG